MALIWFALALMPICRQGPCITFKNLAPKNNYRLLTLSALFKEIIGLIPYMSQVIFQQFINKQHFSPSNYKTIIKGSTTTYIDGSVASTNNFLFI